MTQPFNRSVSTNVMRPDEHPTCYNLKSPICQPGSKKVARELSQMKAKVLVSPVPMRSHPLVVSKTVESTATLSGTQEDMNYYTKKSQ